MQSAEPEPRSYLTCSDCLHVLCTEGKTYCTEDGGRVKPDMEACERFEFDDMFGDG